MRKIIAAVLALCLMLGAVPAFAEEDAAVALVRAEVEKALGEMLEDATGWEKEMLEAAQIGEIDWDGRAAHIGVDMPRLRNAATERDHARDGAQEYLEKALASYFAPTETVTFQLSAVCKEDDGELTVKWGSSTPKSFRSKVRTTARNAAQSYATNEVKLALNTLLLPRAAKFYTRKPEVPPEMDPLTAYAAQVADTLGLTPKQASDRLPCLILMTEIIRVDFLDGMDAAELTVRTRDWQEMLQLAEDMAREAMPAMTGLPEMSAQEIEEVLCRFLPAACVETYFTQKGVKSRKLTVDVASVVKEGPQKADGVMEMLREFGTALDGHTAALMDYAKTLPYYPAVELIDTKVLSGEESEDGVYVTFDTGNTADHGYVYLCRGGKTVLSGFIHSGVRLMVRLAPGDYQVYCTTGPEWFGEENLFGREGYFGTFALTVEAGDKLVVHMENNGGNLAVDDLSEADFRHAIGQK